MFPPSGWVLGGITIPHCPLTLSKPSDTGSIFASHLPAAMHGHVFFLFLQLFYYFWAGDGECKAGMTPSSQAMCLAQFAVYWFCGQWTVIIRQSESSKSCLEDLSQLQTTSSIWTSIMQQAIAFAQQFASRRNKMQFMCRVCLGILCKTYISVKLHPTPIVTICSTWCIWSKGCQVMTLALTNSFRGLLV